VLLRIPRGPASARTLPVIPRTIVHEEVDLSAVEPLWRRSRREGEVAFPRPLSIVEARRAVRRWIGW
jgi:hypothetical protein